jgi:hypothetical protein
MEFFVEKLQAKTRSVFARHGCRGAQNRHRDGLTPKNAKGVKIYGY